MIKYDEITKDLTCGTCGHRFKSLDELNVAFESKNPDEIAQLLDSVLEALEILRNLFPQAKIKADFKNKINISYAAIDADGFEYFLKLTVAIEDIRFAKAGGRKSFKENLVTTMSDKIVAHIIKQYTTHTQEN